MITILAAIILIFITFLFICRFSQKTSNVLPGPWSLPILGSLHLIDPQAPYLSLTKMAQKYGPVYRLKFGMINSVVISDAKILKKILLRDETLQRPPLYLLKLILQNKGILFSSGDLWKDQRKFLINFLNMSGISKFSKRRKSLEGLISRNAQEFVEYVENQEGVIHNLSDGVAYFVSCITSTLFLGKLWSRDNQTLKSLFHDYDEGAKLTAVAGPLNFLPFLRFLPNFKDNMCFLVTASKRIHKTQGDIINEARQNFNENESTSNLIHVFLSQQSKSFSQNIYNLEQLRFLLVDMFGASIETTTTSILWILLYLAEYEEIQDKLRQELVEVLQNKNVDIDDLSNLPYLEATIAEVARIRTVVPLGFPHYTSENVFVDNFTIQKGTMIIPLLWGIHMDCKNWKTPEEFCPERFLNNEGKFSQPEYFMPFQIGKRICLGETLAKMVIALFVANVVRTFRVKSKSDRIDFTGVCGITLAPKPQNLLFVKL